MTYIYDVLLNFTDEKGFVEFFEWDKTDVLEHIKKIPIIKVSAKTLQDLTFRDIKVERNFLLKIKGQTTTYKKIKNLEYALLITDSLKVIALEFNNKGEILARSDLLLDEEEEIIEESALEIEETIPYTIMGEPEKRQYLTRTELKKKRYLLKELDLLLQENNIEKLNFLYEELYKKDNLSFKEKYLKLRKDIEENYSAMHNQLYEIVRLTYSKK